MFTTVIFNLLYYIDSSNSPTEILQFADHKLEFRLKIAINNGKNLYNV